MSTAGYAALIASRPIATGKDLLVENFSRVERRQILKDAERARRTGQWGPWETIHFPAGTASHDGRSWAAKITTIHRNGLFGVLDRTLPNGVRHLAISIIDGVRPTWPEAQRIKNELAGTTTTAVEVYPPQSEVVDGAPMYHLWVLPGDLPFSLYHD